MDVVCALKSQVFLSEEVSGSATRAAGIAPCTGCTKC
jgi:hypothetical protein